MGITKTIRGKVIRILDTRNVIVNLGGEHGVSKDSVFRILGDVETVVDPDTKLDLGALSVVKAKIKAIQVFPKFTVAATKWTIRKVGLPDAMVPATITLANALASMIREEVVDEGEMKVDPKDIKPWKAQNEETVRVGDIVEVEINLPD